MLRERTATLTDTSLGSIRWIAALMVSVIGACLKADEHTVWPVIAHIIVALRSTAWWTVPSLTILAAVSTKVRDVLGNRRKWKVVQVVLDHYWQESFAKDDDTKDDPHHFHRVTMFKHCRFHFGKWPFSGWMMAVARSGHSTKSGIRCFRASLDKPDEAEGVAGRAFAYQKIVTVHDLPKPNAAKTNDDDVKRY